MIRQQGALSARRTLVELFRIVRQNNPRNRKLFGLCSVSRVRCRAMKIMERIEAAGAVLHHSKRTVDVYQAWVRRFLEFHRDAAGRWRHPRELRGGDVSAFLTYLAHERRLSASSQNQAMNAIVFLYGQVLAQELESDHLGPIVAQRKRHDDHDLHPRDEQAVGERDQSARQACGRDVGSSNTAARLTSGRADDWIGLGFWPLLPML